MVYRNYNSHWSLLEAVKVDTSTGKVGRSTSPLDDTLVACVGDSFAGPEKAISGEGTEIFLTGRVCSCGAVGTARLGLGE